MNSSCKMIRWNSITVLCVLLIVCWRHFADGLPETGRRPQLFTIRKRQPPSKPFIVRIRTPNSDPAGRSVPPHMPPEMVRESSIVHIKPVIRFHHSEDVVHLAPMNQTKEATHEFHETLKAMGLSTMSHLLEKTGLDEEILQVGLVTLFAPTDEAFTLGPRGLLESLLEEADGSDKDRKKLRTFLLQHAIRGHLYAEDVRNDLTAKSLHPSGSPLRFNVYDGGQMISVSGSQFLGASRLTGHDRILLQPVDKVLHPATEGTLLDKTRVYFPETHSLLIKAGLAEQLASGTFTLLAPTNDAFSGLPEKAREILLKNSTMLRRVMLNHIIPGTYFSTALTNGYKLKSLSGPVTFTTRRGLILVNGIPIVKPDLPATNGVLHALNRPLVPDELVEQCRCMPKYSLAPATLRPSPQPPFRALDSKPEESLKNDHHIHTFGTRLKPLTPAYPAFPHPEGHVLSTNNHRDRGTIAESSRPPSSLESEDDDPPLDQLLGTAVVLPDGRKLTFNTANRFFSETLIINNIRYPGRRGLTVLLPSDSAFSRLSPEHLSSLRRDPDRLKRVLQWHILDEKLEENTLQNNTPVRTIGGNTLMVTVLPDGKGFLIGGTPVLRMRRASNGAVFVIDHVFDPPPETSVFANNASSLASASLERHPDNDLSIWRQIIDGLPEVRQQLKSKDRIYTMFAPTNGAFRQLPPEQLLRLLADNNSQKDLIWSHVMEGAYYRRMLAPGMTLPSLGGNLVRFDLMPGGFVVNDVPVTRAGIVTSNGVIYIVDKLLVFPPPSPPYRSLENPPVAEAPPKITLEDVALQYGATTFMKWIHASGLRDVIQNQRRCTIFLPTNDAVSSMSPTLRMATVTNPKILARFVRYHVCGGTVVRSRDGLGTNNRRLTTLLPGKSIRCNVYNNGTVVTASGCPVSKVIPISGGGEDDEDGMSVVIVNKTMSPPVGDLFLTASKSPMLRNFTKIIQVSGMEKELRNADPLTIFSPTKCVFAKMPAKEYLNLITDPEAAKEFVKRHVVRGCVFTSGMSEGMTLTTLAGTTLKVGIPPDGCIRINGIKLKYGDMVGTNGVLHVIAEPL